MISKYLVNGIDVFELIEYIIKEYLYELEFYESVNYGYRVAFHKYETLEELKLKDEYIFNYYCDLVIRCVMKSPKYIRCNCTTIFNNVRCCWCYNNINIIRIICNNGEEDACEYYMSETIKIIYKYCIEYYNKNNK